MLISVGFLNNGTEKKISESRVSNMTETKGGRFYNDLLILIISRVMPWYLFILITFLCRQCFKKSFPFFGMAKANDTYQIQ